MLVFNFIYKVLQFSLFLLLSILFISSICNAQEKIIYVGPSIAIKEETILPEKIQGKLSKYGFIKFSKVETILQSNPKAITLQLGDILPDKTISLPNAISLERYEVLSPNARLVMGTKDGDKPINISFVSYKGSLGDDGWITLSISRNGIEGLIRWNRQTYSIQPSKKQALGAVETQHIIYNQNDLKRPTETCGINTESLSPELREIMAKLNVSNTSKISELLTAKVAVETDYETYVSFDNDVEKTTAYLLSLIANVSQIYEHDINIKLNVTYMKIWTTSNDPYTKTGFDLLPEFQNYWLNNMGQIDRDVAMLVIEDPTRLEGGIAAGIDVLCDKKNAFLVTGSSIYVIAHELGHIFGSPHTHNCLWPAGPNGTLAAIDTCSALEGGCDTDKILQRNGTIMSYCLQTQSIFHPLCSNLIRSRTEYKLSNITPNIHAIKGKVQYKGGGLANVQLTLYTMDDVTIAQTFSNEDGSFILHAKDGQYFIYPFKEKMYFHPEASNNPWNYFIVAGGDVTGIMIEGLDLLADQYEPDYIFTLAKQIPTDGTPQHHTINSSSDVDWISFDAIEGRSYLANVTPEFGKNYWGATIDLFDSDGISPLVQTQFEINWEAPKSGKYYLKLSNTGWTGMWKVSVAELSLTQTSTNTEQLQRSTMNWGDYNNDGYLDLLLSGIDNSNNYITKLYKNEKGQLIDSNIEFDSQKGWGNNALIDFNNDGNLDIISGLRDIILYINTGGNFTKTIIDTGFLMITSIDCGDYDNDGYSDIAITSWTNQSSNGGVQLLTIYHNEGGTGRFSKVNQILRGVDWGIVKWIDYDQDGQLDLVVSGSSNKFNTGGSSNDNPITVFYHNSNGVFTDANIKLDSFAGSPDFEFCDYNNDGYLDFAISGINQESQTVSKIYKNERGNFVDSGISIAGVRNASINWGDFTNDGKPDLILTGLDSGGAGAQPVTKIYINTDNGFKEYPANNLLPKIAWGSTKWVDFDNSGSLGLSLVGGNFTGPLYLFKNGQKLKNEIPSSPKALTETINGKDVILSWDNSTDDTTPSLGITYNVRIGTSPGGTDILSPMSNLSTGKRQIVKMGNSGLLTQKKIKNLKPGKVYYWSVQSIDNNFAGSIWANEKSFTLMPSRIDNNIIPIKYSLSQNFPNPFNPTTKINFDLPENAFTKLIVYDILGREASILINEEIDAGYHEINFDGSKLTSGIYFYRIQAGDFTQAKKMILMK